MSSRAASNDLEITLNLWYIYDDDRVIYRLLGRAYVDAGLDDSKLAHLQAHAKTDYLIARQADLPPAFHTRVVDHDQEDGRREGVVSALPLAVYNQMAPLAVFEELIKTIEAELPGFCPLSIPGDPLVCLTPLLLDDSGNLTPRFADQVSFGGGLGR